LCFALISIAIDIVLSVSGFRGRAIDARPRAPNASADRKATLIERYGPDKNMVDLRLELAAGCPKIAAGKIMNLCGVVYPDRIEGADQRT
jgi:hypothetical protein